jgi:23S rRNA pseudouridine2605 synthase
MREMRLAKFLAHAGVASRRAAEQLVFAGRISVEGEIVRDPARDVGEASRVELDGRRVALERRHVVYALNKPVGYVSTAHDPQGRPTVVSLVSSRERLYPVGRLDADTTGLILLTNDGELAHRLTHPSFAVPRVYRAEVARAPVRDAALQALRAGVQLEDGRTAPARVRRLAPNRLELTIREGRKRQVRRMCDAVGHPVVRLVRVAFGPLGLGDLAPGAHRRLSQAEVERLRRATAERPAGKGRRANGGRGEGRLEGPLPRVERPAGKGRRANGERAEEPVPGLRERLRRAGR